MYSFGVPPPSDCCMPTFRNPLSVPSSRAGCRALDDGTDRGFRNVGIQQSDAGETRKRIHNRFKTRRKFIFFVYMLLLFTDLYAYDCILNSVKCKYLFLIPCFRISTFYFGFALVLFVT